MLDLGWGFQLLVIWITDWLVELRSRSINELETRIERKNKPHSPCNGLMSVEFVRPPLKQLSTKSLVNPGANYVSYYE